MPEMDFFGTKAKGEKVAFVVHFGPATINEGDKRTPFTRMTGLTIRNRLEDLIDGLPEYTLFNVTCYWAGDCWPMEPNMQLATPANKHRPNDASGPNDKQTARMAAVPIIATPQRIELVSIYSTSPDFI